MSLMPSVYLLRRGERAVLRLMEKQGPATVTCPDAEGAERSRVYINTAQYFGGVRPDVWAFHVGGYQVCQKWLKDCKGRTLTFDDIKHYRGIVAALGETIRLMGAIDEAIDNHGGWPPG